jgi:predicted TIM-barrel fold metal-dependent hydrolase
MDIRKIPFVDAHVHLWDLKRIHYPWLTPPFDDCGPNGSVEAIASDYLLDDYLRETAGWNVVGIVHVEAGAHPSASLDETAWLQGIAESRGLPQAIVAHADLTRPDLQRQLEAQLAHANVRGIRHIVNWHPSPSRTYTAQDFTHDPGWWSGLGLLGKLGLSFDLQAYPNQFANIAEQLRQYPETQIILNHTGMAIPDDTDGWEIWRSGVRALAELPNVSCKISGMGFGQRKWDKDFASQYVLETIEIFGAQRTMIASDFPTDRLFGTLEHTLGAYAEILSSSSEDEQRDLFGRNAVRIYRLPLQLMS